MFYSFDLGFALDAVEFCESFFESVESLLAHAAFAIPAVRGIEFGTFAPI